MIVPLVDAPRDDRGQVRVCPHRLVPRRRAEPSARSNPYGLLTPRRETEPRPSPARAQGETPLEPQPLRGGELVHGPYADASTVGAAELAAETVRYLNHAAANGGISDPATISAATSSFATAACRHGS